MSKHPSNLWSPIQSSAFQIKPCSTLAAGWLLQHLHHSPQSNGQSCSVLLITTFLLKHERFLEARGRLANVLVRFEEFKHPLFTGCGVPIFEAASEKVEDGGFYSNIYVR